MTIKEGFEARKKCEAEIRLPIKPSDETDGKGATIRSVMKTDGSIILVLALILIVFSCYKAETETSSTVKSQSSRPTTPPLVTFIELGSINCIPCKMMQPIMRDIESSYKGQVAVIFYDVWTQADAPRARQYGIRVIPTQVFLDSNGDEYYRHEGFFPKEELVAVLKKTGVK